MSTLIIFLTTCLKTIYCTWCNSQQCHLSYIVTNEYELPASMIKDKECVYSIKRSIFMTYLN